MAWSTELPEEKPKRKSTKKETPATGLIEALKFLKPAQKKSGELNQQYCCLSGNWAVASDEVLTIGTPIKENLFACPQSFQFEEALKQVKDDLSLTQLSSFQLCVSSGASRLIVPCVDPDILSMSAPDENVVAIDDRIRAAIDVLEPLVTDKVEETKDIRCAAMMLQSGTAVATNDKGIIEYWHGISELPTIFIPKVALKAILKTKKKLSGFGYSGPSATFWFEDGSFIKTQLYDGKAYGYKKVFTDDDLLVIDIPDEFFNAVKTIDKFTENNMLYFENGNIMSQELESEASSYTIKELPEGMVFNAKFLMMVRKGFKKAHFTTVKYKDGTGPKVYFFGDNCRGTLLGVQDEE